MIGVSGVFGSQRGSAGNDSIDNLEEVSSTVDDIIEDVVVEGAEPSTGLTPAELFMRRYARMERRVTVLTWAVVALFMVLLAKELKNNG